MSVASVMSNLGSTRACEPRREEPTAGSPGALGYRLRPLRRTRDSRRPEDRIARQSATPRRSSSGRPTDDADSLRGARRCVCRPGTLASALGAFYFRPHEGLKATTLARNSFNRLLCSSIFARIALLCSSNAATVFESFDLTLANRSNWSNGSAYFPGRLR